jgi:hypothetical protein
MNHPVIDLVSTSGDNHANEPSSACLANASQAVAPTTREALTKDVTDVEPMSVVPPSLSKNLPANGAKAEAKRKRHADDEIALTTTKKRVGYDAGNGEMYHASNGPSLTPFDELLRKWEAEDARRAALSPEA